MNSIKKAKDFILFPNAMTSAIILGGITTGALYLFYKRGRVDQINEFCNLVKDQGDIVVTFHYCGEKMKILLQEV